MLIVILAALVATALAGLVAMKVMETRGADGHITWREYAIGVAISPAVAILVAWAGWAMARHALMTFTEYWNGWETGAVKEATICTRDGPCRWEYDCDPYIVMVSYDCNCTRDSNGHSSCQTCYRPETRYHSCPYVQQEFDFLVDTTLGRYAIASQMFPEDPQAHRWRPSEPIPQSVIDRAGTGEPPFWVAVKRRCQSLAPGPVTARRDYPNYILASEHTLMREHSSDVADYRARNLMPALARSVQSFYHTDKTYFIGWMPSDRPAWSGALEYLNANFGRQLHGDLHLVVVKDDQVAANPERYGLALKAHWQDKGTYGNDALSKNAVVVIIGTADGATVSWSRAFTGMPLGNERLIVAMRDGLKGSPLTSEGLIGPASSRHDGRGTVLYPPEGVAPGPIQRVLWGMDDPATAFKRVSMSGKDGRGGFLYLKNEIQPTTGQMWAISIVTFLVSCGVWVWASAHRDTSEGGSRYPY